MALLEGIAAYLDQHGLVDYRPGEVGGDCFLEKVPQQPDHVVSLFVYGGDIPDAKLGYDLPLLQVRTRSGSDPAQSRATSKAIYDLLHGLSLVALPEGTTLVNCIAQQSDPTHIGADDLGRHEHTINYQIETRNTNTRE